MEPGYEILEHTADIGIRSFGPSLEKAFEQAGLALAEILGAMASGDGRGQAPAYTVRATADDRGALLVDFLNELLLLHETRNVAFASVEVTKLDDTSLEADVRLVPLQGETETTGVKAATYHRLAVEERDGGYVATVYLDV
jgi:SHS2 domain-containing protein